MIVVVAALEFASQSDRDEAVALVADVQRLTREEEPGCHRAAGGDGAMHMGAGGNKAAQRTPAGGIDN